MLRRAFQDGAHAARHKYGLALNPIPKPASLGSVGISAPTKSPGLPAPGMIKAPSAAGFSAPKNTLGKMAAIVGMNATSGIDSASGAVRGEPADQGRRQRSVIDRTFQANEDNFATSSMPMPGSVSP